MGVKDLWAILTPHSERKPICELRGKTVAIDLAGWVCESLNVVDYYVHPRHHLKNLFFRTCYLIWEEVTPIFVLEGVAPKLKSQVIAKRNEVQFRGVRPRGKDQQTKMLSQQPSQPEKLKDNGRTRFNHVLKQCETLLQAMGIQCVQGPGEAEAYCAFLNKKGLVDGVISQDSDCFAYGAVRVYRNFSVSTQGAQAAQGGAVDIYDMRQISQKINFGQNKMIVMALLCGCDYCPEGIGGIGRDGVLKLFNKYSEEVILERIRSWRNEDDKYTALEMRVDDKTICSNCGHMGRTQSHTKNGCGVCRTNRGCDESLWKEERISLKAELMLRKKALAVSTFPSEEVIKEFLSEPPEIPKLNLNWKQPNVIKFIKQIGHLLQWPEIYCFQKFLPVLTRWQVRNAHRLKQNTGLTAYVEPKEILKKRTLKGVPSLELIWQDESGFFNGLMPNEQLKEYEQENAKGVQDLWTTVEPLSMLEEAYPELVEKFIKSKEKLKKTKKLTKKKRVNGSDVGGSLDNLNDLMLATNEIAKSVKPKHTQKNATETRKGLQLIDKFFKQKMQNSSGQNTPIKMNTNAKECYASTPLMKCLPSDLESDCDEEIFNISDIVNGIVKKSLSTQVTKHAGHVLHYESISKDLSLLLNEGSLDDLDLMAQKRRLSICTPQTSRKQLKRISLDDSFDILVNKDNHKIKNRFKTSSRDLNDPSSGLTNHVGRFKMQNDMPHSTTVEPVEENTCYFFNRSVVGSDEMDAFEEIMEFSFAKKSMEGNKENDVVLISDSSDIGDN